jgi:hypothetical protein
MYLLTDCKRIQAHALWITPIDKIGKPGMYWSKQPENEIGKGRL